MKTSARNQFAGTINAVELGPVSATVGIALAVQDPATGYPTLLALALAAGIGGGNFASSMANISFFYPAERKGTALGTNAGLGNLGVPLAQFVLPLVVASALFGAVGGAPQPWQDGSAAQSVWLQNAGLVFVLPILAVAALAWRWMTRRSRARTSRCSPDATSIS